MSNTDVPGISLHDFNNVEGRRLWGFLNIKEEGLFPRTPFLDREGQMSGYESTRPSGSSDSTNPVFAFMKDRRFRVYPECSYIAIRTSFLFAGMN